MRNRKEKKNEKSVSSISIMDELEKQMKREGKAPLGRASSCSGASGSWKNLKK